MPVAAVAVTLVLWSSAFVAIRHLGHDVTPGALSLGRLLVASIALTLLLLRSRRVRLSGREVVLLLVCGVAWFGIYNIALNDSERRIDAATAAMLVQVGPIIVALLAAVFLGERLTGWLLAGIAVAFAGVVVIGSAMRGEGGSNLSGVLLALLAAVTYAIGVVTQKVLLRRLSGVEVVCYACWIGVVVCLPWSGDLVDVVRHGDAADLGWIGYLGFGFSGEVLPVPPAPGGTRRLPAWWFGYYDHVLRRDQSDGEWWFEALCTAGRDEMLERRFEDLSARARTAAPPAQGYSCGDFLLAPSAGEHKAAVGAAVDTPSSVTAGA